MSNLIKLGAATGTILVGYKSLEYAINKAVEQYLPEPVAKNFPTPLVAGGVVLAAVGVVASYAGVGLVGAGASSLLVNPSPTNDIGTQIITLGNSLRNLACSGGIYAINQLNDELKGTTVQALGDESGVVLATITYNINLTDIH